MAAAASGRSAIATAAAAAARDAVGPLRSVLDVVSPPNKTVSEATQGQAAAQSLEQAQSSSAGTSDDAAAAVLNQVGLPAEVVVIGKDLDLLATIAMAPETSRSKLEEPR